MKRIISISILIVLVLTMLPAVAFAAEVPDDADEIINFDDGSYLVISLSSIDTRATISKTGSKIYTYYASDDTVCWKATLKGTFTYNGSTSSCTDSSCTVSISDSAWYVISKSASKSGNTASASLTMGYKMLGVTVNKVPLSMSLSCDKDGKLS